MPAGEQLLTNLKYKGPGADDEEQWFDAGDPVPDLPEDVLDGLRETGAVGIPEQTPEQIGATMDEIDTKLQDRFGVSLSELMTPEEGSEEAVPDEDEV